MFTTIRHHLGRIGVAAAAVPLGLGAALAAAPASAAEPQPGTVPHINFYDDRVVNGVQLRVDYPRKVGDASIYETMVKVCNRTTKNMPVGAENFSYTVGTQRSYSYAKHDGLVEKGLPSVVLGPGRCVSGVLVNSGSYAHQLRFTDYGRNARIDVLPATEWEGVLKVGSPISPGASHYYGDVTGDKRADVLGTDGIFVNSYRTVAGPTLTYNRRVGHTEGGAFTWLGKTPDLDGNGYSDLLARTHDGKMQFIRVMENGRMALPIPVGSNWQGISLMSVVDKKAAGTNPWLVARAANGDLIRYQLSPQGIRNTGVIGKNWNGITKLFSAGDLTGDGIPDLLAVTKDGKLMRYGMNAQGAIVSTKQIGRGWNSMIRAFVPGDMDGDARRDLVAVRSDGHLYFYKNLGGGNWGFAKKIGQNWQGVGQLA